MNRTLGALAVVLSLVTVTFAAEPVSETYGVPLDKAWSVTQAVLKQLGWDVEKADPSIGLITTDSRRVEGEDYGVYAKGTRHRLVIHLKAAGTDRTTLPADRTVVKREQILRMDNDEPIATKDQTGDESRHAAIRTSP